MIDGLTVLEWYEELHRAATELIAEIDTWEIPQVDDNRAYGEHTALGHLRYVTSVISQFDEETAFPSDEGQDDRQMNDWNDDRNEH